MVDKKLDVSAELQSRIDWAEKNKPEVFSELADASLTVEDISTLLDAGGIPTAAEIAVSVNKSEEVIKPEPAVEPVVAAAPAPVAPVVQPVAATPVPSPKDVLGESKLASADTTPINKNSPVVIARLKDILSTYVVDMAVAKPNTSLDGANIQRSLYRAIHGVIYAKANGDFTAGMGLLFDTIDEHKTGVFKERYAFRYFSNLNLAKTERLEFENWMRLFLNVAPKDGRKESLSQTSLPAALLHTTNDEVRERLMTYIKKITG